MLPTDGQVGSMYVGRRKVCGEPISRIGYTRRTCRITSRCAVASKVPRGFGGTRAGLAKRSTKGVHDTRLQYGDSRASRNRVRDQRQKAPKDVYKGLGGYVHR